MSGRSQLKFSSENYQFLLEKKSGKKAGASETASDQVYTFIVIGASGDLSIRKIYPSLFNLFRGNDLPKKSLFVGYARTAMDDDTFRGKMGAFIKEADRATPEYKEFEKRCFYVKGPYDDANGFKGLGDKLAVVEKFYGDFKVSNRLFYLSVPPSVFVCSTGCLKPSLTQTGNNRIVVEKPFGYDLDSSNELQEHLSSLFHERQLFRIDHYLGKEMVMNLMVFRFANTVFEPVWNRNNIKSVIITFKEDLTLEGRGGYFDSSGIIRDVMQNHLLQILSLVAMEPPVSLKDEDIQDEKVKVLKCMPPIKLENCVVGQYEGYTEEDGVPKDSVTPTYACCKLQVFNSRWEGVPFFLKCGKALDERKAEIRIQFNSVAHPIFGKNPRNELVIRIQPDEAIYLKVMAKQPGGKGMNPTEIPGYSTSIKEVELDLTFKERFGTTQKARDAYEYLIQDVFSDDHSLFVRSDELQYAWQIFTPILKQLEGERIKPVTYKKGVRSFKESDDLIKNEGYQFDSTYEYKKKRA